MSNIYKKTKSGKQMRKLESEGWHNCEVNLSTGVFTYSKYMGENLEYNTKENITMRNFFGKNEIVSDEIYKITSDWVVEHAITDDPNYLTGKLVRLSAVPEQFSDEARVVSIDADMFCYMPIGKDSLELIK